MERKLHHNLGLDLVRAAEAAALEAGRWMGFGDPEEPDRAATQAMVDTLGTVAMDGHIVVGERHAKEGPLVTSGQRVGSGDGPAMDVVLDAIDGRHQLARGFPGALSAIAAAPSGAFWNSAPAVYMEKVLVNAEVAPALVPECLDAPAAWTLALVARAKEKSVRDLTVFILERPRHADLIDEIRNSGARIMLRADGDIGAALVTCSPDAGIDVMMGTGGVVEGLLAACITRATGGQMFARLNPQSREEREEIEAAGLEVGRILNVNEVIGTEEIFFAATGITDGPVLEGIHFSGQRAKSNSMILRGETRTRRLVFAEHLLPTSPVMPNPEPPSKERTQAG